MPKDDPDMGWTRFDEESVMHERRQSHARTQKAKALVSKQEAVLQGILKKMNEEEDNGAISPSASDALSKAGSSQRFRSWSAFSRQSLSASTASLQASTLHQQALIVANQILTRQEKTLAFHFQRKENITEAKQRHEHLRVEKEAAEARFAERRQALAEERRRRAFAAQQRRNEQKAFRETLREQDRLCDEYYKQQLSGRSNSLSPSKSLRPEDDSECEKDIHRHMLKSHSLYTETVERWRHQVAENDCRAEAFRKRVLKATHGSRQKEERASLPRSEGRRSISRVKKGGPGMGSQEKVQTDSRRGSALSATSPTSSLVRSGQLKLKDGLSRSMPCLRRAASEMWSQRWQASQVHGQEKEMDAIRKQQQDEEKLEGGRQRIAAINQDIMTRAAERSQKWQERNDAAASRRQLADVASEAEMAAKLEAGAQRKADLDRRRADELAEAAAARALQTEKAQATAAMLLEKAEKAVADRARQRDELVAERHAMRLQDFASRADPDVPQDQAEAAKSRKRQLEEEFRLKAKKEMEMKARRRADHGPVLERQRTLKTRTSLRREGSSLPPDLPFAAKLTDSDLMLAEALEAQQAEKKNPAAASQLQNAGRHAARVSIAGSLVSMDDEDVEREMLQALEERSSHWMKEMRRQKENSKRIV